ncbi:MAG: amidohydrolase family protein [Propionibacteriaceae bacterium]
MLIDVHAHHSPKQFTDAVQGFAGAGREGLWNKLPHTDAPEHIAKRLELMDQAGVQMQVLSHGILAPYAQREEDAVKAAHAINDGYAQLTRRYPDRFLAHVSLPLPHIDASLAEMRRGMDELGMCGVAMNCSVFNRSTAEQEFEPLYAEMDQRGAILYFHPCGNGICSPMVNDYGLAAAGTLMEDTVIALHLIVRQIPHRFPNIRVIISHLGGMMPVVLNRLDHQLRFGHPDLPEPPSVTARRFYYDTVGHGSDAALLCAWKAFGAGHLLPGSDWPVLLIDESYSETFGYIRDVGLPSPDVEQILESNAPALFNVRAGLG